MLAALLHGPGDIRVEDIPKPTLSPGEALVRVRSVGVCASDLHFFRHGEIGGWGFKSPALLGHEWAGEIVEIRPADPSHAVHPASTVAPDDHITLGDVVAVEPTRPCGECDLCQQGRYNICRRLRFAGQPPDTGAFCEYASVPLNRLFRLPPGVTVEEGAMVEPLAVAVHAVRLAGVTLGSTVGVLGAGAIGLSLIQTAAAAGARSVYVSDPIASRRDLARALGATDVFDPDDGDPAPLVADRTGGGVDIMFEASGGLNSPALAVRWVGAGGTLSLVGIPDEDTLTLPMSFIRRREIVIRTVRRYCGSFPTSLDLIASGKVNTRIYGTHHFGLQDTLAAFRAAADHPEEVLRAIVDVPGIQP